MMVIFKIQSSTETRGHDHLTWLYGLANNPVTKALKASTLVTVSKAPTLLAKAKKSMQIGIFIHCFRPTSYMKRSFLKTLNIRFSSRMTTRHSSISKESYLSKLNSKWRPPKMDMTYSKSCKKLRIWSLMI